MKILKIKYKNFKSYGNKYFTLDFEKELNNTFTLLSALNGSGKSALKDVFEYALYGRVDGLTLQDLPNRTNKNLEVYIKFISKDNIIEIERGISPNYLRLYKNGVPDDRAGKRNIQEYIEEELFDIPYSIFKNIISISVNNFKSFLVMSPKDKRDIIDKIFGFDVINNVLELIKTDKKVLINEINVVKAILGSISNNITDIENKILNIEKDITEKNEVRVKTLKSTLSIYKNNIDDLDVNIKKLNTEKDLLNNSIKKSESEVIGLNKDISINFNKLSLYKNNKCAECESELIGDFHNSRKEFIARIIKTNKSELDSFKKTLETDKNKLLELNKSIDNLLLNKNKLSLSFKQLADEYKFLTEKREIIEVSSLYDVKNSLMTSLNENKEKLLNFENRYKIIEVSEIAFSNNGIKQNAISSILPLLNSNIKETFDNLSINFNVKIDNNFDCVVTSLGEEINIKTLSTGERSRVDFAIIISLMKIIKLQYPDLNILFIDEFFSNIDLISINSILEMLKLVTANLNITVFVVSHIPVDEILFDRKIFLNKIKTFTEMEIV